VGLFPMFTEWPAAIIIFIGIQSNTRPLHAGAATKYPQASACFIQSVKDSMQDIMRLAASEAMLF